MLKNFIAQRCINLIIMLKFKCNRTCGNTFYIIITPLKVSDGYFMANLMIAVTNPNNVTTKVLNAIIRISASSTGN